MLCARFHLDEYAVLHNSANNSVSTKCFYATAASTTEVSVVRERQGPKLECLQNASIFNQMDPAFCTLTVRFHVFQLFKSVTSYDS